MRGRALCAVSIGVALLSGIVAEATEAPRTVVRASGPSPFPSEGCGQIDHFYWGAQTGLEADVALAANPDDPDHLVAAWIQDEGFGIVTGSSFDGGATWTRSVVPGITLCTGGGAQRVLHARLAFGPGGHVWVAGETLDGYFPDPRSGRNGIPVAASRDGGRTWSQPVHVETMPAMNGLNHIVADPSSAGSVVASWHSPEPVATSYLSRSDDGGASWQATAVPAYAPDALPFQRLAIAADGTYHLFTVEATLRTVASPNAEALVARRSSDRGLTWSDPVRITGPVLWQWPTAAVAPDGSVYVQFLNDPGDGSRDLFVARSADRGATWAAPVVVARGLVGPEPSLTVTGDGVLASAHTTGDATTRTLRLARSMDGGTTWSTEVLDGHYPTPSHEGFYNETVGAGRSVAAVYTKAGATDGPTDVFVAVWR